jgi:hypothetical protein
MVHDKHIATIEINLLFTSFVILEGYKRTKVKQLLLNEFYKKIYNLTKRNIYIKNILFDCVTLQGTFFKKHNNKKQGSALEFLSKNNHSAKYELKFNPQIMENNPYKTKLIKAYKGNDKF